MLQIANAKVEALVTDELDAEVITLKKFKAELLADYDRLYTELNKGLPTDIITASRVLFNCRFDRRASTRRE